MLVCSYVQVEHIFLSFLERGHVGGKLNMASMLHTRENEKPDCLVTGWVSCEADSKDMSVQEAY